MITGGLITSNTWIMPLFACLVVGTILFEVIKEIRERRFNKKYRKGIEESHKKSKMKNGDDWYW